MPALAGISHIDLTVTDIERSLRFYTEVLGFEVVVFRDPDNIQLELMDDPEA